MESADKKYRVLIVDDEKETLDFCVDILREGQAAIATTDSENRALTLLKQNRYDLLITDKSMESRESGLNLLRWVRRNRPETGVILFTAYANVENAVEAMQNGALDYIEKPFDTEAFKLKVTTALERVELMRERRIHMESYNAPSDEIIGTSPALRGALELVEIYAKNDGTVLITGESGAGKELIAKRIHAMSRRHDRIFVVCDTASIHKETIPSELFGHVKGAFTGATSDRAGKFEVANRGTLFLDEIGDMDLSCQKYLLRAIDEKKVQRLGCSNRYIDVDVRVIAATNRDLWKEIREGRFREDLYFRIAALPIPVPPLREREGDVSPIAEYFLRIEAESLGKQFTLSDSAKRKLEKYSWPGNVRMLKNTVKRAAAHAAFRGIEELGPELFTLEPTAAGGTSLTVHADGSLSMYHEEIVRQLLQRHNNNKKEVARILGISEATMHNWLKKFLA